MSIASKAPAFFHFEDNIWFVGNDPARGPWTEDACHAGPVTGVIARELEASLPEQQLFRLTVELYKPVPMSGFKVICETHKTGRMISSASAKLLDKQNRLIGMASSLHATVLDHGNLPTAKVKAPKFEEAEPGDFPVKEARHGLAFFGDGIDIRYPPDENSQPGPTTVWMRTLPLIEGETPSPFQMICPIADCGNGISRNVEVTEANFLNPDLTIIMYRAPQSEWIASKAKSFWEPTGLGMSEARLFDTEGPIGAAMQTLLVSPMQKLIS